VELKMKNAGAIQFLVLGVIAGGLSISCQGKVASEGTSGAGGTANDSGAECRPTAAALSSVEVIEAARCVARSLPNAVVATVRNEAALDYAGFASSWIFMLVDGESGLRYGGTVSNLVCKAAPAPELGKGFRCTTGVNGSVSSVSIVPDALKRLAGHGIAERIRVAYFWESGSCEDPPLEERIMVFVQLNPPAADAQVYEWWVVNYSVTGAFQRVCGPCDEPDAKTCDTCYAQ
jgi:hypothetical protein